MEQEIRQMRVAETPKVPRPESNATGQQTYCIPEIIDLGQARILLQGGSSHGMDNFFQTQW
jgi:hypothetical protein